MIQNLFEQMNKKEPPRPRKLAKFIAQPRVFSVTEFYAYVNGLLGLEQLTVEGEISEIKLSKGYLIYFSINDKEHVLPCLMFKNKLDTQSIPLEALEVGARIQITGYPNIYEKAGKFTFLTEKIALVGEGALKKAFELLKKKLTEEGLFDAARKRPIPLYPECIGLITSRGAAAYTDFIKVMNARWGGMKIYFYPASVQGESAVDEIIKGFDYFNTSFTQVDVVVLTRGGGSLEDLTAFNAEPVVRAVRASKWPVVCAVGHERDESLAELAADLRASTPSNAAELLTPTRVEERQFLVSLQKKLMLHLEQVILQERQLFERALSIMDRFFQKPKTELMATREHLERLVGAWIGRLRYDVEQKERLLKSFDPHAVLKRGYSITASLEGNVIKSMTQVVNNDKILTTLYDGTFQSTVDKKG